MLILDIKQHFISYYGVTTTSYRNAILKRRAVKHIILILYTVDHRLPPSGSTHTAELHKFKLLCDGIFRSLTAKTLKLNLCREMYLHI